MNINSPELMPPSGAATAALASATRGDGTAASTMTTLTGTTCTSISAVDSSSTATIADASSALITPTKGAANDGETNLEQHSKKDKKRQLQLQLTSSVAAVGKSSGNGITTTSTLSSTALEFSSSGGDKRVGETAAGGSSTASEKQRKKLKSTETAVVSDHGIINLPTTASTTSSAAPTSSSAPASIMIKWPPVSSAKALPPLLGRVFELSVAKDNAASTDGSKKGGGMRQQEQRNVIEFEVNQECEFVFDHLELSLRGVEPVNLSKILFIFASTTNYHFSTRYIHWTSSLRSSRSRRLYRRNTTSLRFDRILCQG
jgi:hypothetical protein